ncbi:hypothetical protein OOK39_02335 [Streptomyces sp. NBC_00264]|uniref:hypothetical protein n=1 Tax=unclassified Streptomyces TaxID=2593676 RepID=UPI002259DBD9|nr:MULTISPECIES: hypothetical protein [unclassified Streptomyces]MCX5158139.1 hypothetical protein [Streptomyces sp. NBC_00305]MCX5216662.1 hypothetical protein [Streptomyces sp. NBC_00264]
MTATDLARLDVPTTDWAAAADELTALKAERLAAGLAAEYRHLLYDADPGSTVPAFVDLHHHKTARRGTR